MSRGSLCHVARYQLFLKALFQVRNKLKLVQGLQDFSDYTLLALINFSNKINL